ncbi:MAG TPA: hypothetical protein PKA28_19945 [Methylomusa anaerophila]|uniref:Uncharacterized protein n=1 Tax=Methylomusa anaerophila TaxID=1930071 RepID=A0A348AJP9_9FIRM|nr:hypothetical protein [Methylomusa anaerophila]BBB91297.1 hypothetical protein MAMMFC1_01969 [Methylomusa anaerophila]HML90706.1 hypothetical protein [Methylomusa anaerophila]
MNLIGKSAKKTVAILAAGAFILTGAGAFAAQTSPVLNDKPGQYQHKAKSRHEISPEKAAQRIAEISGASQETILKYNQQGHSFRDLSKAAFFAKVSGKSLDDVLALKTADNSWKDVRESLNISTDQIKAAAQEIAATRLSARLNLSKENIQALFREGYRQRDIAMAGILAKHTGKPVQDILSMKKINNSWQSVAASLGVDKEAFKQDVKAFRLYPDSNK